MPEMIGSYNPHTKGQGDFYRNSLHFSYTVNHLNVDRVKYRNQQLQYVPLLYTHKIYSYKWPFSSIMFFAGQMHI